MDPVRFPAPGSGPAEIERGGATGGASPARPSFGEALESALDSVSQVQAASDEATRMFALGREVDLHTVLLQVEKADLSFRTMMEVRNKLLEAYREIMRMPV
jgi:flagellar hook-basal body complex protein FliE